jgi:hypothetical protein
MLTSVITPRPFRKPNTIESRGNFKDQYVQVVENPIGDSRKSSMFSV